MQGPPPNELRCSRGATTRTRPWRTRFWIGWASMYRSFLSCERAGSQSLTQEDQTTLHEAQNNMLSSVFPSDESDESASVSGSSVINCECWELNFPFRIVTRQILESKCLLIRVQFRSKSFRSVLPCSQNLLPPQFAASLQCLAAVKAAIGKGLQGIHLIGAFCFDVTVPCMSADLEPK